MDESLLLPFQREGVAAGVALGGRILIGDEMGLGKTVQAIALAARYRAEWPLLVLCPTSMCLPWCEELERWCPFLCPGDINLVRSHHNGALKAAPVTVLSYGLVTNGKEKERLMQTVMSAGFGVAIADEAHFLKNKEAQRTQLVLPALAQARRCILLTGTPALSRPVELFTLISTLRPDVPSWRTYSKFVDRYCDAKRRWVGAGGRVTLDVSGCSNAEELHILLTQHVMIRRLKSEVLKQLPAKRRQRVLINLSTVSKGSASATAASAELLALQKSMDALPKVEEFKRQQLLSSMCVQLGTAKAHAVAEYCQELLISCDRLVFFGHHRAMLDAVASAFATSAGTRVYRIDGETPAVERQQQIKEFQALPSGQRAIFLISILAAGVGITLTAASTAVFGELRWVPGELLQAEDRLHRIGQSSAVNIHYVVAQDSADEAMWAVLQRKVRTLGVALDGKTKQRLHVENNSDWHGTNGGEDGEDEGAAVGEAGASGEGDGGSSSGDALSLLARKTEREKKMKAERQRQAFSNLFGAAATRRKQGGATSSPAPSAATPAAATAPQSSASSGPIVIDLDDDSDDDKGGGVGNGGAGGGGEVEEENDYANAVAWFAVSSLTGRIHAYGDGDAPLESGLGASALPHAILDDEPSSLPAALAEPRMLAAAQRWCCEYESLTPAQRAALSDRPLRVPLISASSVHRPPPAHAPPKQSARQPPRRQTPAPAVQAAASPTVPPAQPPSQPPRPEQLRGIPPTVASTPSPAGPSMPPPAQSSTPTTSYASGTQQPAAPPPPSLDDLAFELPDEALMAIPMPGDEPSAPTQSPAAPQYLWPAPPAQMPAPYPHQPPPHAPPPPPFAGGGGGGSTTRETNSEQWAMTHLPAAPYVTTCWETSSTAAVRRVWYQHFEPETNRPYCLFCTSLHWPAPDSPFCGEKCAASYKCAASQKFSRLLLFERELGVCQMCGFNAHKFYLQFQALQSEQARLQMLMSDNSPFLCALLRSRPRSRRPRERPLTRSADRLSRLSAGRPPLEQNACSSSQRKEISGRPITSSQWRRAAARVRSTTSRPSACLATRRRPSSNGRTRSGASGRPVRRAPPTFEPLWSGHGRDSGVWDGIV